MNIKELRRTIRFWENVRTKQDDCWNWIGPVWLNGYGQFRDGAKTSAHRYSWKIHFGSIPKGMMVCHTCDNKRCVRPDHLFLGTAKDNMADCSRKGRVSRQKGDLHPQSKLNSLEVLAIRASAKCGAKHSDIAKHFNVSRSCISMVVRGESWSHINDRSIQA